MRTGRDEPLFPEDFLRRIERLTLVARRERGEAGPAADRRGGRIEFADHRSYAPGDDLRYLDWHLYGRHGLLFLKEFVTEEEAEVSLVLDTSGSMARKLRAALRLSAALLAIALARGDRIRVAAAAEGKLRLGKPLQGEARRPDMLVQLASLEGGAGGGTDLDKSLRAVPPHRGAGRRLLILVSDLLAERDGRRTLAGRREDLVVLHFLNPEDRAPPAYGRVSLCSAEGGDREAFVGPEEAERYRRECERFVAEIAAFCARRGGRYVLVPAEQPAEEVVLSLLAKEGLVR